MLPEDWAAWGRTFRRRPLWEHAPTTESVSLGRVEIERLIPHRAPFLLVDEITAIDPTQAAATGRRAIDPADPVFAGHFPGDPVYPGVLQLEMAGQLGIWLAQRLRPVGADPVSVRAIKIHHAVFAAPVKPGDEVELRALVLEENEATAIVGLQVIVASGIASVSAMELYRVE